MITSKEFAKLIGTSQATVSRAMNNSSLVPEEKRKYIQSKAEEYGFVLNSQARSLKTNKASTIGLLFPVLFESLSRNMMLAHIYDLLQREFIKSEYDLMMVFDDGDVSKMSTFERVIKSSKVDGFVILRPRVSDRGMELLRKYDIPWVALFGAVQDDDSPNQFIINNEQAGFLVGDFYGKQANRDYIFITIADQQRAAELRRRGFERGLNRYGKKLEDENVLISGMGIDQAYETVYKNARLFQGHKTASFVHNDMMAIGVINALKDMGLSIPEEAEVIGVDGIPQGNWFRPRLTTVQTPLEDIVHDSCECLFQLIKNVNVLERRGLYLNKIIHRETTIF